MPLQEDQAVGIINDFTDQKCMELPLKIDGTEG
jgi:hypothetical protein